jgi:hypothetical protein
MDQAHALGRLYAAQFEWPLEDRIALDFIIATRHELLDAAKGLQHPNAPCQPDYNVHSDACLRARAAIRKAEGK